MIEIPYDLIARLRAAADRLEALTCVDGEVMCGEAFGHIVRDVDHVDRNISDLEIQSLVGGPLHGKHYLTGRGACGGTQNFDGHAYQWLMGRNLYVSADADLTRLAPSE